MIRHKSEPADHKISHSVERHARRKIKARREGRRSVWFGLGMLGLIGWSITVPMLIGISLGVWLDKHHPGPGHVSWALTGLFVGVAVGCMNAWYWIDKERH